MPSSRQDSSTTGVEEDGRSVKIAAGIGSETELLEN
jgi:hypothetical protein